MDEAGRGRNGHLVARRGAAEANLERPAEVDSTIGLARHGFGDPLALRVGEWLPTLRVNAILEHARAVGCAGVLARVLAERVAAAGRDVIDRVQRAQPPRERVDVRRAQVQRELLVDGDRELALRFVGLGRRDERGLDLKPARVADRIGTHELARVRETVQGARRRSDGELEVPRS